MQINFPIEGWAELYVHIFAAQRFIWKLKESVTQTADRPNTESKIVLEIQKIKFADKWLELVWSRVAHFISRCAIIFREKS